MHNLKLAGLSADISLIFSRLYLSRRRRWRKAKRRSRAVVTGDATDTDIC